MVTLSLLILADAFIMVCIYAFLLYRKEVAKEVGVLPKYMKAINKVYALFFVLFLSINFLGIRNLILHSEIIDTPLTMFVASFLVVTSTFIAINIVIMRLMIRFIVAIKLNQKDELTGFYNKSTGISRIDDALSSANSNIYVAMLDIDNFKMVNDIYGHLEGDVVLKRFSNIMQSKSSNHDILCRFGGDEFVIALVGKTEDQVANIFKDIRDEFNVFSKKYNRSMMSISIGYAKSYKTKHCKLCNAKNILYRADIALYTVKNAGKNAIHKYVHEDYVNLKVVE